jgi:hypothetical protein
MDSLIIKNTCFTVVLKLLIPTKEWSFLEFFFIPSNGTNEVVLFQNFNYRNPKGTLNPN